MSEVEPLAVLPAHPSTVALSDDETLAACRTIDGDLSVMTIPAGKVLFSARANADEIGSIAFAPGDRLLATASHNGKIGLWRRSQRGFDSHHGH